MAIATRANGTTIGADWFNDIKEILSGDLLPRDASADALDLGGSLGSELVEFASLNVIGGDFSIGDIVGHHTYNGAAPIGEGWMLCDGRIVSEANYNAEHGAGAWVTYIGSSALDGKYLPDFRDRFTYGGATTPADGSIIMPTTGNPANIGTFPHNHKWYEFNTGAAAADTTYDSSGNPLGLLSGVTLQSNGCTRLGTSNAWTQSPSDDLYTETGGAEDSADISPDSIGLVFYMRVI